MCICVSKKEREGERIRAQLFLAYFGTKKNNNYYSLSTMLSASHKISTDANYYWLVQTHF